MEAGNLQAAINAASSGEEVWAAPGAHGTIDIDTKTNILVASAYMSGEDRAHIARLNCTDWNGVEVRGFRIQPTTWPSSDCVRFDAGTMQGTNVFRKNLIKGGYGASLVAAPVSTIGSGSMPEISQIVAFSDTATTSSQRLALNWDDTGIDNGKVYVTNNGANNIYVTTGDGTVTATTGDTAVNPAATLEITVTGGLDTHLAFITASGTSAFSGSAQQGLDRYMASGMTSSGSITWTTNLDLIENDLEDLFSAVKGPFVGTSFRNNFRRIYEDARVFFRNAVLDMVEIPYAESSDAEDPHSDVSQWFLNGTVEELYDLGTITLPNARGNTAQGYHWRDNLNDPSYSMCAIVGSIMLNGSLTGARIGTASTGPAGDFLIDASTFMNFNDIDGNNPVSIECDTNYAAITRTLAGSVSVGSGGNTDGNLALSGYGGSRATILPNWGDLASATTREDVLAALATSGDAAAIGAAAHFTDIFDLDATDADSAVDWTQVHPGTVWSDVEDAALSTTQTFDLRRVLIPIDGVTVAPGAGVEWRSVDTDGSTEVQAWTSSSGTIDQYQYLQWRSDSPASYETTTSPTLTVNGLNVAATITTAPVVSLDAATVAFDPAYTAGLNTLSDETGSTPGDGDPVGYMADLKGDTYHATQATTGNRPTYETDSTYHWIEAASDGKIMSLPWYQTAGNSQSVCFGIELTATTKSFPFILGSPNTRGLLLGTKGTDETARAAAVLSGSTRIAEHATNGLIYPGKFVVTATYNRSDGALRVYVNGVEAIAASGTAADLLTDTVHTLFSASGTTDRQWLGRMYRFVGYDGLWSSSERAEAQSWVNAGTGAY